MTTLNFSSQLFSQMCQAAHLYSVMPPEEKLPAVNPFINIASAARFQELATAEQI